MGQGQKSLPLCTRDAYRRLTGSKELPIKGYIDLKLCKMRNSGPNSYWLVTGGCKSGTVG